MRFVPKVKKISAGAAAGVAGAAAVPGALPPPGLGLEVGRGRPTPQVARGYVTLKRTSQSLIIACSLFLRRRLLSLREFAVSV